MAINNLFLDNVELDESTSLVHLLDTLSDYDIDENTINLTHSYYVDELTFISTLLLNYVNICLYYLLLF